MNETKPDFELCLASEDEIKMYLSMSHGEAVGQAKLLGSELHHKFSHKREVKSMICGCVQVLTLQFSRFHADFEQHSFSKSNCILQAASGRLDESLDSAAQVPGQVQWVARNSTDRLSSLQCATVLTAEIFLNICPHPSKRIHSNSLLKAFLEESSLATTCSTVIRVFSSN